MDDIRLILSVKTYQMPDGITYAIDVTYDDFEKENIARYFIDDLSYKPEYLIGKTKREAIDYLGSVGTGIFTRRG